MPEYNSYVKASLAKLTAADVTAAIRRHLRAENIADRGRGEGRRCNSRSVDRRRSDADAL